MQRIFRLFGILAGAAALSLGQLSTSAYRTLGQPNLHQNGANLLQGTELHSPTAVAVDTRNNVTHIYISDSGNARILGWNDTGSYQIGDPPGVILGQAAPTSLAGNGDKGFNAPLGMAVDPATGNLYAADPANNRILRFPSPFSNPTNFTPDAVIGQTDFTTNGAGSSASGLNGPVALAFDSAGNLWVSDSGNNRVVRFPAAVLASLPGTTAPQADLVIGQKSFGPNTANAGAGQGAAPSAAGFSSPEGIAIDAQNNLFVADFNNLRVMYFPAPLATNAAATQCFGQANCTSRTLVNPPTSTSLGGPVGIAVTAADTVYAAVPPENRVLAFPFGSPASVVYGQSNFSSTTANAGTQNTACPLCPSANGLASPDGVTVDAAGNVYVADTGNNRVLMYASGSRTATKLWGQATFSESGVDQIKPGSLYRPYKMAIDYSQAPFPLYVSDANNNRVLIWKDSIHFHNGDPADLVIGQPDLTTGIANVDNASQTPTATSLFAPSGIAVDQSTGNLYVADFGNNRVLHYPRPVNQTGRITADFVLGQSNFTSSSSATITAASLSGPIAVALGPGGEVFVSDGKNNRVLQYAPNPAMGAPAIQVYGQPNLNSGAGPNAISPQTLLAPSGIFIDPNYNLYVADSGANRVVVYPDVQGSPMNGRSAQVVFGQAQFTTAQSGGGTTNLNTPLDVAVDSAGTIYVADYGNSRVVTFPPLVLSSPQGQAASSQVTGAGCGGATPNSMCGPVGIYLDRKDTLYAADSLNSRVLQFLKVAPVANAVGFVVMQSAPVAPGSIATLKSPIPPGTTSTAPGAPWPSSLGPWQLTVNDTIPAPMYYAGTDPAQTFSPNASSQINFQVPSATPAGANVIAVRDSTTGELLAGGAFSVANVGPGLFTQNAQGFAQGSIINGDGVTVNSSSNPAARGSVVSLYGTGQGPVSPPVPDGQAALSSPLAYAVTSFGSSTQTCLAPSTTCVIFNNSVFGTVQFSGLAPGFVGLWQINVQIPSNAPTGNVPVKVTVGGVSSNTQVTMAIK